MECVLVSFHFQHFVSWAIWKQQASLGINITIQILQHSWFCKAATQSTRSLSVFVKSRIAWGLLRHSSPWIGYSSVATHLKSVLLLFNIKFGNGPGPDLKGGKPDKLLSCWWAEWRTCKTKELAISGGFSGTSFYERQLLRPAGIAGVTTFANTAMGK